MADVEISLLRRRLARAGVDDVRPLAGGASSLTYAGVRQGRPVVVKVAPAGVPPVRNRDVLRQARMLRALAPTAVPVPAVVAQDPGDPPDMPPLFVMSFVEGSSLEPLFDRDGGAESVAVAAERARAAARTLAALHRLEPEALGLVAEPWVGPADEVARWSRLLETVDPALVAGWADVAEALRASEPPAMAPAVVHGDFRLGNLLAVGAQVAAVVDWEIWSVGDPRVDVGWFLVNTDPATYGRATAYTGLMPAPAELAAIYAAALGRDVAELGWFQALACFKSTATWSLIVKHNRRREHPDPSLEEMAPTLPHLLDQSRRHLG